MADADSAMADREASREKTGLESMSTGSMRPCGPGNPRGLPGAYRGHSSSPEAGVDALLVVVLRVIGPVQVIRLINEQDPAHGPVQNALGLRRRLPDELSD